MLKGNISLPLNIVFPDYLEPDEYGLVALGGVLSTEILIEAYSKGIFPWAGNHPVPWYSPDPRLVLFPEKFHLSKSLKKVINKGDFQVKYDNDFPGVISRCAGIRRRNQDGTWIDQNIISAYTSLFEEGVAHCVEVYMEDQLAGGLYGLSLGTTFFGESMFALRANASKIALYYLTRKLISQGLKMIDCQQSTAHLQSLGAEEISRKEFLARLDESNRKGLNLMKW